MRCLCLLLCVLALFSSCKESEKDKIARLVEEWEGKEILFPARSVFTIQGKDTVNFSFVDADYKVVTYIDSVGCTSCKLQLPRWKLFMQEVDSTLNRPIPFVFYFHPKDMKELRYITRRDAFIYPVCFDEMDDFNRLNHFPDCFSQAITAISITTINNTNTFFIVYHFLYESREHLSGTQFFPLKLFLR